VYQRLEKSDQTLDHCQPSQINFKCFARFDALFVGSAMKDGVKLKKATISPSKFDSIAPHGNFMGKVFMELCIKTCTVIFVIVCVLHK
jgi:hypothetical protein